MGALVALLAANDSGVDEGLTSRSGTRVLRALPGAYRVRVRRIGSYPFVSRTVWVPTSDELLLRLDTQRVYWTELDPSGAVMWNETTSVPVESRRPFGAASPAILARRGYVR